MAVRTSPVPGDGKYEPIVIDSDEDEGVMVLAREGETVVGPAGGAAEVREVEEEEGRAAEEEEERLATWARMEERSGWRRRRRT